MSQIVKKLLLFLLFIGLLSAQSDPAGRVDSSNVKSPGKALLFSLVPGGGQLYNRHPLKALLFAGAFTYYAHAYTIASDDYEVDITNESLHRARNDKVWMMSLIWSLNILDAYVDAQLWDFNKYEIENGEQPGSENQTKTEKIGQTDGKD